jgi:hypothetical protein
MRWTLQLCNLTHGYDDHFLVLRGEARLPRRSLVLTKSRSLHHWEHSLRSHTDAAACRHTQRLCGDVAAATVVHEAIDPVPAP